LQLEKAKSYSQEDIDAENRWLDSDPMRKITGKLFLNEFRRRATLDEAIQRYTLRTAEALDIDALAMQQM
jgi:hypothetical protein